MPIYTVYMKNKHRKKREIRTSGSLEVSNKDVLDGAWNFEIR